MKMREIMAIVEDFHVPEVTYDRSREELMDLLTDYAYYTLKSSTEIQRSRRPRDAFYRLAKEHFLQARDYRAQADQLNRYMGEVFPNHTATRFNDLQKIAEQRAAHLVRSEKPNMVHPAL